MKKKNGKFFGTEQVTVTSGQTRLCPCCSEFLNINRRKNQVIYLKNPNCIETNVTSEWILRHVWRYPETLQNITKFNKKVFEEYKSKNKKNNISSKIRIKTYDTVFTYFLKKLLRFFSSFLLYVSILTALFPWQDVPKLKAFIFWLYWRAGAAQNYTHIYFCCPRKTEFLVIALVWIE